MTPRAACGGACAGLALILALPALAQTGDLRKPETYETWVLVPADAQHEIPVEGSVRLQLRQRRCLRANGGAETCVLQKPDLRGKAVGWTVNGYLGGGPEIGQVRTFQDRFNTGGDVATGIDVDDVVYVAPARVPSPNPVAVAAEIGDMERKDQIKLVTHVKVVDMPGWRGSFHVRIRAVKDVFGGLANRSVSQNPIFVLERSVFDADDDIDLTTIESDLVYTVTGVAAEAYEDDGRGIVVLETRPQGSFSYFQRTNGPCARSLTIAEGERAAAYLATPLYITLNVLPNGVSVVDTLPNVAFDVKGHSWRETCDSGSDEPYVNFFEGVTVGGQGDVPPRTPTRSGVGVGMVGLPGDGRSYHGDARAPLTVRFAGVETSGEAQVSWSLSRK